MAKTSKKLFQARGISAYSYIKSPDTQFNSDGVYQTQLKVKPDAAKALIAEIQQVAKDNFKDGKCQMPFATDKETGDIVFRMKSKYQPKVSDSAGKVLPPDNMPNIYGGSDLVIKGTIFPYSRQGNDGISLQMGGVQIVELSEYAGSMTFDAVDGGGWTADMADQQAGETSNYNF